MFTTEICLNKFKSNRFVCKRLNHTLSKYSLQAALLTIGIGDD